MSNDDDLNISAGIVFKLNPNKILLCHPTDRPWKRNLTIPKGHVKDGEKVIDAAVRETKEEVGIEVSKNQLKMNNKYSNPQPEQYPIWYIDKDGNCFKRVYYFLCEIDDINEIGLESEKLMDYRFDDEIDWAKFLTIDEAKEMIFRRFDPILERHF